MVNFYLRAPCNVAIDSGFAKLRPTGGENLAALAGLWIASTGFISFEYTDGHTDYRSHNPRAEKNVAQNMSGRMCRHARRWLGIGVFDAGLLRYDWSGARLEAGNRRHVANDDHLPSTDQDSTLGSACIR